MKASGTSGQLRVGGRVAATLSNWSYDGTPEKWTVEADTTVADSYLFDTDRQMDLRLHVGERIWKWRGVIVRGAGRVAIHGEGKPE